MEKLTSLVAVLEYAGNAAGVLRKAVTLARRFDAAVELLIVEPLLKSGFAPHVAALDYPHVRVHSQPRAGEPLHDALLRYVARCQPDMLVKARAGDHPLRRCTLAPNDWRLSQECPVPLMLVDSKPWVEPPRFCAAVDVADPQALKVARAVLHTAGFLALGCRGNLDVVYTERELHDDLLRMERAVQLAQLVREFHVGCERLQMFDGVPEKRLPPLIAARRYDVLVLGAVSHRSGITETICPLTSRLVDATAGDVVLVKEASAVIGDRRDAVASTGEQASHQLQ